MMLAKFHFLFHFEMSIFVLRDILLAEYIFMGKLLEYESLVSYSLTTL